MPGNFQFADEFSTDNFVSLTQFSTGAGPGIDDPAKFHVLGGSFHLDKNEISVAPIALQAGQTLHLDLDFGASNNINKIDTEIRVIDSRGKEVAVNDTSAATDKGSPTTFDPSLAFLAGDTGLYYVVVTHKDNDYNNNTFTFDNGGKDTGVFQLDMRLDALSALSIGTNGDDNTTLLATQRRFDARDGDDFITSSNLNTSLDGGDGNDGLSGQDGRDLLFGGQGDDSLQGNNNRDLLMGGEGNDYLGGGAGRDDLFGGSTFDNLYGDSGDDSIYGEEGDDNLNGEENNDWLIGGIGDDYMTGGAGNDKLLGGDGRDTANYYDVALGVRIDLSKLTAQNTIGDGFDALRSVENVNGSNTGDDKIAGNAADNSIYGNGGNDSINGAAGNDNLYGYGGKDTLTGGAENDFIFGYSEADTYFGGIGSDYFGYNSAVDSKFATPDTIGDFKHAEGDHIALGSIYDDELEFIGAANFTKLGQLRVVPAGGGVQAVLANIAGDKAPDFRILVTADATLVEADFFL